MTDRGFFPFPVTTLWGSVTPLPTGPDLIRHWGCPLLIHFIDFCSVCICVIVSECPSFPWMVRRPGLCRTRDLTTNAHVTGGREANRWHVSLVGVQSRTLREDVLSRVTPLSVRPLDLYTTRPTVTVSTREMRGCIYIRKDTEHSGT